MDKKLALVLCQGLGMCPDVARVEARFRAELGYRHEARVRVRVELRIEHEARVRIEV